MHSYHWVTSKRGKQQVGSGGQPLRSILFPPALIRCAVAKHSLTHPVRGNLRQPGIAMQNQAVRVLHLQHSSRRPSVPPLSTTPAVSNAPTPERNSEVRTTIRPVMSRGTSTTLVGFEKVGSGAEAYGIEVCQRLAVARARQARQSLCDEGVSACGVEWWSPRWRFEERGLEP